MQVRDPKLVNAITVIGLPPGVVSPYAGSTAPDGWLLCAGQAVSRTAYIQLFRVLGIQYGIGDGSTTFNLPDMRGRVPAGYDLDMSGQGGTSATSRLTSGGSGVFGNVLGNAGGVENVTLTSAQSGVPQHSHANTLSSSNGSLSYADSGHAHGRGDYHAAIGATNSDAARIGYQAGGIYTNPSTYSIQGGSLLVNPNFNHNTPVYGNSGAPSGYGTLSINNGNNSASNASSAHSNVQPTIVLNYIIKV